jgi:hypothetical protein
MSLPIKIFPVGTKSKSGERPGIGWSAELGLAKGSKKYAFLPGAKYHVGPNYTYITDPEISRVIQAFGVLKIEEVDRHKPQQTAVGKLARETGDQGGHLFGTRFGGSGQAINIVPMAAQTNQKGGAWYSMEETLAEYLADGHAVHVNIDISYMDDYPLRPCSFVVTATIDGHIKKQFTVPNPW